MTVKQFRECVKIAEKYGNIRLTSGSILYYHGEMFGFSLVDKNGNTIDTTYNPKDLEYICD